MLKLRNWRDQHAGVVGKMLLLQGMLQFGYPKQSLKEIVYNEYKRPFFEFPIDFNISHSGQVVVCALSDTCKVGIDVEEIRPLKIEDFKNVLSANEYNNILISKKPYHQFFTIWTKKEAVLKAEGKGLFIPLTDVVLHNDTASLYNKTWYLKQIFIAENYSLSLATSNPLKDEPLLNYVNKEHFNLT